MKFKAAILSLFTFLVMVFPVSAFAATLSLDPSTGTANKNCTLSVTIKLDTEGEDTDGTDVILSYDTTKLSANTSSVVEGKIYASYEGTSVQNGKITISGLAPTAQAYNGSGTFATVNFQVLSTAAGNADVKFDFDPNDKSKTTDTNVVQGGADPHDILSKVIDGSYTIGTGSCNGTTTTTTTTTTTGGGIAAGTKTLPAGNARGGVGTYLPAGGPATDSGLIYKQLPVGGLEEYTWLIAGGGVLLTILGAVGLALL